MQDPSSLLESGLISNVNSFLCALRDDYGFTIDSNRICRCICASADITNQEEVRFRMQTLVCKSEQEIAVFQEQFDRWQGLDNIIDELSHKAKEQYEKSKNSTILLKKQLNQKELDAERAKRNLRVTSDNSAKIEQIIKQNRRCQELSILKHLIEKERNNTQSDILSVLNDAFSSNEDAQSFLKKEFADLLVNDVGNINRAIAILQIAEQLICDPLQKEEKAEVRLREFIEDAKIQAHCLRHTEDSLESKTIKRILQAYHPLAPINILSDTDRFTEYESELFNKIKKDKSYQKAKTAADKAVSALDETIDGSKATAQKVLADNLDILMFSSVAKSSTRQLLDTAAELRHHGKTTDFVKYTKAAAAMKAVSSAFPLSENELMKYAELKDAANRDPEKIISHATEQKHKIDKQIEDAQNQLKQAQTEQSALEEQLNQKQRETELLRIKAQSLNSRPDDADFNNSMSSVWALSARNDILNKTVASLTSSEQKMVRSFIRDHAIAFKHTMRRKQVSPIRRKIDVRATVKAAVRFGGDPYIIKYKKPKKSHAKVVCLVDLSGSCKNAATLSLYFMALMNDVFVGGCSKFVFVNRLIPVDDYFRNCSPDDGVKAVISSVHTHGVYSDYGTPIASLHDEYVGLIGKETTILVIGDARGNHRNAQVDKFKDLCDKARAVYWLNPDDEEKWDQGDSDIGLYKQFVTKVSHFSCVGELLNFLISVS